VAQPVENGVGVEHPEETEKAPQKLTVIASVQQTAEAIGIEPFVTVAR
jgi:hypothetical protein